MELNGYIRRKTFWTFFIASVLTSLISQINCITDGIIISHLITSDAIAAIGLASPILSLLFLGLIVIVSGSSIMVSQMIGNQNYQDASRTLISKISSLVIAYTVLAVIISSYSGVITRLITDEQRLQPLLEPYLRIYALGLPVPVIYSTLACYVKLAGKPRYVTAASLVFCIGNIGLDLLFIGVFNLGIKGAALATIASGFIATFCFLPYFRSKECLYHMMLPDYIFYRNITSKVIKTGLPSGIGSISQALLIFGINAIVLKAAGANGIFVVTVGLQMLMICSLVVGGACGAVLSIGGVLLGEKDIDSYRSLFNGILKKTTLALMFITLILFLFPDVMARLFGANGDLLAYAHKPLRYFSLLFLPYCILTLLDGSIVLLGYRKLSSIINIVMALIILVSLLVSSIYFPDWMWYSIPAGMWLIMAVYLIITWSISRRQRDLHWMTLISGFPNDPSVSRSVPYSKDAIQQVLSDIRKFISICELKDDMTSRIEHCVEELTYNIVEMAELTQKKGFFDIRVVYTSEEILIVLKDDNRPYNPICHYNPETGLTPDESNLGLIMVNSMCKDINYAYMNGINCTYLKFRYASEPA